MAIQQIPQNEVSFNSTSYIDPNGRIFSWQGRIFRSIEPSRVGFYKRLLAEDFYKQLSRDGFIIGTRVSQYTIAGSELLLEHDRVQFLSYCPEWPASMLKEAALLTLTIVLELNEHDLTLQDAYPWNIYFRGHCPVFIDVGSIVPSDAEFIWKAYDQFCRFFLYPLYLHSMGKNKVARLLLTDYWEGISEKVFLSLVPFSKKVMNPQILFRVTIPYILDTILTRIRPSWKEDLLKKPKEQRSTFINKAIRRRFLKGLYHLVESIRLPQENTHWVRYYEQCFYASLEAKEGLERKKEVIEQILNTHKPRTLLDVGANTGYFSMLAARMGIDVIAGERDENCLQFIYRQVKKEGLSVIPVVFDFINPLPSFGWCCKQFPSALERLRCDMVMALALIHHLVFKQWQNFDRIAETLDALSNRWAVVEFIPPEDPFIQASWEERFNFYTYQNFQKSMRRYFKKIDRFDSYPKGRIIIACEK